MANKRKLIVATIMAIAFLTAVGVVSTSVKKPADATTVPSPAATKRPATQVNY